jgi:hypothetical protein
VKDHLSDELEETAEALPVEERRAALVEDGADSRKDPEPTFVRDALSRTC